MITHSADPQTDRRAMYREMQRSIPGLDAMYRLVPALVTNHADDALSILVVGAGGGREIEALGDCNAVGRITAIDPSARNLDTARVTAACSGASSEVRFIVGTVRDLQSGEAFDLVTSLLVMHHLHDDGAKLEYLKSLRDRLAPGGRLIHADVCFGDFEDFDRLIPIYLAYADIVGVCSDATRLELSAIPQLPIISGRRTRALFVEAGLTEPVEVFRSLWYRCWTSSRAPQ
ncbi:class I SAM-dependent methyltransferase [Leisingera sp. NJS204]|uniref:class I SAM-dependent methyltransferase n=1 Tax=Leisingera sp. NJS204 TaxID=2508307 RepID=UPI0010127696|nr:class I SAM-dependent methyltransferase [Leisingera sp. NJS204]QAX28420.1 class I SAM-dependent methyltransferase [Leisingera sp. NJS204]